MSEPSLIQSACSDITSSGDMTDQRDGYLRMKKEHLLMSNSTGDMSHDKMKEELDFVKRYTPIYKRRLFTEEQQKVIENVSYD